jgi:hypothetical protein
MKILTNPPSVSVVATGCSPAANRFLPIQVQEPLSRPRQPMRRPRTHSIASRLLRHIYQLRLLRRARVHIARIQYRWEQGKGKFLCGAPSPDMGRSSSIIHG